MRKKIFVLISIMVLIGATTFTVASAGKLFLNNSSGRISLDDLKDKWNELRQKKAEYHDLLESYGFDLPDLSDEQKWEIWSTMLRMKREGAARDEIRDAIEDLLEDYGVDLPGLTPEDKQAIRLWIKNLLETEYGFVFPELTEEQKREILQEIISLKDQGYTRLEIRQTIKELLETGYGFVFPELTDSQKEEIRQEIETMLETDYDFDIPDLTPEQRDNIKEKKKEIRRLQIELRIMYKHATRWVKLRFYSYVKNQMNPPAEKNVIKTKTSIITNLLNIMRSVINRLKMKLV
jgi:hypothetical protein